MPRAYLVRYIYVCMFLGVGERWGFLLLRGFVVSLLRGLAYCTREGSRGGWECGKNGKLLIWLLIWLLTWFFACLCVCVCGEGEVKVGCRAGRW